MSQGLNNFIRITFHAVIFSFLALFVSAGFVNTGNLGMHSLTSIGIAVSNISWIVQIAHVKMAGGFNFSDF